MVNILQLNWKNGFKNILKLKCNDVSKGFFDEAISQVPFD